MTDPVILPLERLELDFAPKPWPFAEAKQAEIAAFFAALQHKTPSVWNGRVLLLHRQHVANGVFTGAYLETDYASFAAWRAWGRPDADIRDCFGAAAVIAADGAVLLGEMSVHTANAGRIYFPCGTPDPDDIVDGRVDLDRSVRRELKEETGLDISEFDVDPGWCAVIDGPLICQVRTLRSPQSAEALRASALDHIARQRQAELADMRIVRGPADFDEAMPRFVLAFLRRHFGVG